MKRFVDWSKSHASDLGTEVPTANNVTRAHLETCLGDMAGVVSAATVALHYRGLRAFWNWLESEDEIDVNPFTKMRQPTVPDPVTPVFGEDEITKLLDVCKGRGFTERRDYALIALLADTGIRLGELTGMTTSSVQWQSQAVMVVGKGERPRLVPIGNVTMAALDKYMRARRSHPSHTSEWFWLGVKGPLTDSGVAQLLKRRGKTAGVVDVHPHRFRHNFAHQWMLSGGGESDLQRIAVGPPIRWCGGTARAPPTNVRGNRIDVFRRSIEWANDEQGIRKAVARIVAVDSAKLAQLRCAKCHREHKLGEAGTLHADGTIIVARRTSWRGAHATAASPMVSEEVQAWKQVWRLPKVYCRCSCGPAEPKPCEKTGSIDVKVSLVRSAIVVRSISIAELMGAKANARPS